MCGSRSSLSVLRERHDLLAEKTRVENQESSWPHEKREEDQDDKEHSDIPDTENGF